MGVPGCHWGLSPFPGAKRGSCPSALSPGHSSTVVGHTDPSTAGREFLWANPRILASSKGNFGCWRLCRIQDVAPSALPSGSSSFLPLPSHPPWFCALLDFVSHLSRFQSASGSFSIASVAQGRTQEEQAEDEPRALRVAPAASSLSLALMKNCDLRSFHSIHGPAGKKSPKEFQVHE